MISAALVILSARIVLLCSAAHWGSAPPTSPVNYPGKAVGTRMECIPLLQSTAPYAGTGCRKTLNFILHS